MDIKHFWDNISSKKIALCGIGVSNTPLIMNFLRQGARVYACDKRSREQIGELADKIEAAGAELRLGEDYLADLEVDIIFRTPGMSFYLPELTAARKKGIAVTSEMEVFFDLCPATIFAVTGSDGKTTTTTLIAEMLKAQGKTVHVGGNIGNPLLPEIDNIKPEDFVVVELSSFQLISMRKSPDVAVVTNVAPNHLDVHKDMDEYVEAKKNVILHQNAFSRTVLNYDNEITNSFRDFVRGQSLGFSMERRVKNGAWLDDKGMLHMSYRGIDAPIMHKKDITILGDHNVENYLTAIAAVWGYVSAENIRRVAKEFAGVEHRIEFCGRVDDVDFYNDSKGTNVDAAVIAIKALRDGIILIAGGDGKGQEFDELAEHFEGAVEALILLGRDAPIIEEAARKAGFTNIYNCKDMPECVRKAAELARPGEKVLLSPACASWDMYDNFEQRGRHFKNCIKELLR